jgi:hypothetical protein
MLPLTVSISYTIHILEILNNCLKYGILENKPICVKCFRYDKISENLESVLYLIAGYDHFTIQWHGIQNESYTNIYLMSAKET